MSEGWRNHRLGGLLFEPTAPVAPVVEPVRSGTLPAKVDLRQWCSPVENQFQVGSCAANAAVGALEFHQRRAKAPQVDLSRLFVYYNARRMAGREAEDCGTMMSHVMASVMAFGACEEKLWPYIEAKWPEQPPQDCYDNALKYEAVVYARVPLAEGLHTLAAGFPIVFGTALPGDYYKIAGETGITPVPGADAPESGGGHAMLIVGYDMNEQTWLVRNSWGVEFADGGYFRIPFKTLQTYSHPDFFWIFGAIEQQVSAGTLKLSGPSMRSSVEATRAAAPKQAEDAIARMKKGLRTKLNEDLEAAKDALRRRLRGPGVGGGY
jgi:hypothetical protein